MKNPSATTRRHSRSRSSPNTKGGKKAGTYRSETSNSPCASSAMGLNRDVAFECACGTRPRAPCRYTRAPARSKSRRKFRAAAQK